MFFSQLFSTDHWCVKGVIEAPADEVFRKMLENLTPSANALIKLKKTKNRIEALNTKYFEINPHVRSITIRGGYWYEGVFFATSIGRSTLITYRVNNIAEKSNWLPRLSKWLVPLWQYKRPKKMRVELQKFIQQIGEQLQCHAHLERLQNRKSLN
jgi:hypothetical protein